MRAMLGIRPYAGGHFVFDIDGVPLPAYVKSVEGGAVRRNVVDEPIGGHSQHVKHFATTEIEPISLECGFAGAEPLLAWIRASWQHEASYRSGQIVHGAFNLLSTKMISFREALITEVTFPTLDVFSKDPAFLKVKLQPEELEVMKLPGLPLSPLQSSLQKLWTANSFIMTLSEAPTMISVTKIDSFTIRQNVKKQYNGPSPLPELVPTGLVFPNITGTIPESYADALEIWDKRRSREAFGTIEFLSPQKLPLFSIILKEVGLVHVGVQQSSGNQDQLKRAKFELYVGAMDILFF